MEDQVKDTSGYKGLQSEIRDLKIEPGLEVVENRYNDVEYLVEFVSNEFNAICPKTSLPDFATIKINYIPDRHLVESKSLKLYLNAYRNIGIFHEHAVNKILADFIRACDPKKVAILGTFNARGGIAINVARKYVRGDQKQGEEK